MAAFPWWAWMVLAGVLGLAELHFPGSYLIWIALGAAIAGVVDAGFGLSLSAQIVTCVIGSALSCLAGYFVYRRFGDRRRGDAALNERSQSMLGVRGIVCEAFHNGQGK